MSGAQRPGPVTIATILALMAGSAALVRSTIGAGTSSYSDPLTTNGDLVVRAGGATTRLAVGSNGHALTVSGGAPTWAALSSSPTTTRGDIIRRGASADERVALGTSGYILTSNGTDPVWSAPAAVDPVDELPSPTNVVSWLPNRTIRGPVGATAGVWPALIGPDAYTYMSGSPPIAAQGWVGDAASSHAIYQSTSGVMEIRWQGASRGFVPVTPSTTTGHWTLCVVVVGAQTTGTARAIAGWGKNNSDGNFSIYSVRNSVAQWTASTLSFSETTMTNAITSASYPTTTDATALLATWDGTTLSYWKAVAGDAAWVSIGTSTPTLSIVQYMPLMLGGSGAESTASLSTVGIREVIAWKDDLDSTARTALRAYITTAALL